MLFPLYQWLLCELFQYARHYLFGEDMGLFFFLAHYGPENEGIHVKFVIIAQDFVDPVLGRADNDTLAAGPHWPAAGLDDGAHEVISPSNCLGVAPGFMSGVVNGLLDGRYVLRWDVGGGDK